MRPSVAYLIIPLLASPAFADSRTGGGSGGGGALSRVSSGIGAATGSTSVPHGGGPERWLNTQTECVDRENVPIDCPVTLRIRNRSRVEDVSAATPTSKLDVYLGAQKVHDSDGSISLDVIVRDRRFQLAGSFSHYFERLMSGGRLAMSMPSIAAGVRIDDMGPTRVVLEFGAVHASTRGDPVQDSSITGAIAGVRFEHAMNHGMAVLLDAHGMWFPDDIQAKQLRVGLRYKHVQASFRMLDFNVGPALYGPEVGLAF
jgi:hypothetical protein